MPREIMIVQYWREKIYITHCRNFGELSYIHFSSWLICDKLKRRTVLCKTEIFGKTMIFILEPPL